MSRVLSFPFRISTSGAAVTVDQGSIPYYDEQIAVILSTQRGERPYRPSFGIPDIAFRGFQYSAFQAQIASEMPEVIGLTATINVIDDRTEEVVVEYDITRENT